MCVAKYEHGIHSWNEYCQWMGPKQNGHSLLYMETLPFGSALLSLFEMIDSYPLLMVWTNHDVWKHLTKALPSSSSHTIRCDIPLSLLPSWTTKTAASPLSIETFIQISLSVFHVKRSPEIYRHLGYRSPLVVYEFHVTLFLQEIFYGSYHTITNHHDS